MLPDDNNGLYAAFKAKDARFDGRVFVGISSTGIYCRPVCRAKRPQAKHCAFYATAAEAEQAGYRPCLLCRPELAPGASIMDARDALVRRAAHMMEANCGGGQSLTALAKRLGCTDRHLRRVFAAEYNVSPVRYLQTCRLLLAKNLLTETNLPVLEVAMAAGFGSLRRFNDSFQKHYHLPPTALRKKTTGEAKQHDPITVSLGYRPPYRFDDVLRFLAGRSIPGVDVVRAGAYWRTVRFVTTEDKPVCGWVRVGHNPQRNALTVTMSETLLPMLPQALARIKRMFDLSCDPHAVFETLAPMNDIRAGLCVLGTRLPGSFNAFEMAARAVLGQQISGKAASTLAGRVAGAYGTPIETGIEGLTHLFPAPEDILALDGPIENHLGPLGVTAVRSRAIRALALAFVQGGIDFDLPAQPEAEMKKLLAIPGIGNWTAQYIAMRTMEWPDAFMETDVGVQKALAPCTPKQLLHMAESWRPWRSYATINLWNAL